MNADEIRRELAVSRAAIRQDYRAVRDELDLRIRARRVVSRNPAPWLGGAAILGYVLAGPKKIRDHGKKTAEKSAKKLTLLGALLAAARLLLPLARPALTSFATRKLVDFANTRFRP